MRETKVLKADKSRRENYLQFDIVILIAGIAILITSFQADSLWHYPGMILGVLVFLYGIFRFFRTFSVFNTEVTIFPGAIMVKRGGCYCLNWSALSEVVIKERQRRIETGRPDRSVTLITEFGLPVTIDLRIFSKKDEDFLLGSIRDASQKHGFEVKTVEDN